jgi:hypothetical protein
MLSGVQQDFAMMSPQCATDGGSLDELRTRADDCENDQNLNAHQNAAT